MAQPSAWNLPPDPVILTDAEVHVWRAALNLTDAQLHALRQTLTEDEQARAERYHFPKDRNHYLAGRGWLRAILSRYLNTAPDQLRFSYSAYGKPTLTEAAGDPSLRFNVSHSQGLALYAVTRNREIGVDLEFMRADFAGEEIAERFFSRQEVEKLRAVPADAQGEAFFACWTRKEAYIKARGEGLSLPLDQFDVSLSPGEPAKLLSVRGADPEEASRWRLEALEVAPGYAAALAVRGEFEKIQCWQWPE